MRRWLKLVYLKYRAAAIRQDILVAIDRRQDAERAVVELNGWISRAQQRLQQANNRVTALEDPRKLIADATQSP